MPSPLTRPGLFLLFVLFACDRPYARLAPDVASRGQARVVGRLLEAEKDDPTVPWTSLSEDEIGNERLEWKLEQGDSGPARSDEEGWIHVRIPREVAPGRHVLHLRDRTKRRLGTTTVRILDPASAPRVVRSDVDLTYLRTSFHSAGEILELLKQPARSHRPLAGMPELYRGLRVTSLLFVSGSPELFRGHLDARLRLDRIRYDALRLKPAKDVAAAQVLAGRPDTIEEALREQVGYKLDALLADRVRLPRRTTEVLLGDDSEMDAWIYHLYREASSGRMQSFELRRELQRLGVAPRAIRMCLRRLRAVRSHVGDHETVRGVFIRRTDRPNRDVPAAPLEDRGIRFHRTSGELAEALVEMGWLRAPAATKVRAAERPGR